MSPSPTNVTWIATLTPPLVALIFIACLSIPPEPQRQRFSAIFVAGAGAAYLGGGFGALELVFCAVVTLLAYRGLSDYRAIAVAWILHSLWDGAHDLWGNPILPFAPLSSYGCFIADFWLAAWYFAGAPSPWRRPERPASLPQLITALAGCSLIALICIAVPVQLVFGLPGAITLSALFYIVTASVYAVAAFGKEPPRQILLNLSVPFAAFVHMRVRGR
jgi:Family of unknown function (DUF6010)